MLWADGIVPLAVKGCGFQAELSHFFFRDFGAWRISPGIDFRMDSQTLAVGRCSNELDDHFMAGQWLSTPVLADEGKEAVFDLVPFARARRQVGHFDL